MTTWITDSNGNQCAVEQWGSVEKAQKALDSLIDCKNCINCEYCAYCSGCAYCSNCSNCSDCSNCSNCANCWRCSNCASCSNCVQCSGCTQCAKCTKCAYCAYCTNCLSCSHCSRKTETTDGFAPPAVPSIPDIHQRLYAAVTKTPASLSLRQWHTCDTTHSRAGHIIHMAGEAGYALEKFYDTTLAAMLIYDASDPTFKINPCRFYDSNGAAMADMKRLAERS